jgi:Bifunctional DNA primase/polymerase, N-terminal
MQTAHFGRAITAPRVRAVVLARPAGGGDAVTLTIPTLDPDVGIMAAALAYGDCGWYIAPTDPSIDVKNPGTVLGTDWHRKTSRDTQQIAAWFAGTDYGIALHVGRSGAVVFDVDNPDALPDILRKHLAAAPYQSTRPDRPGRGHYVFLQPPGRTIGNSVGKLGDGWGEVRGLNGVIIAAPTPHPDGGEYRWERV